MKSAGGIKFREWENPEKFRLSPPQRLELCTRVVVIHFYSPLSYQHDYSVFKFQLTELRLTLHSTLARSECGSYYANMIIIVSLEIMCYG